MDRPVDRMIAEYGGLLRKFEGLPKAVFRRTFMQIAGYPHYENVCSNILAFFLQPVNEHRLHDMLLKALLAAADPSLGDINCSSARVTREIETSQKKRFDLLVCLDELVIGIENKIYAPVYNDLVEYSDHIGGLCRNFQWKPLKIVLSLQKHPPTTLKDSGFISVTYKELFSEVRRLLGHYCGAADLQYVGYFNDFMSSIESLQGNRMGNKPTWEFFQNNYGRIASLLAAHDEYKRSLGVRIVELRGFLAPLPDSRIKRWIYQNYDLVHDFEFPGGNIAVDTNVIVQEKVEWNISIYARPAGTNLEERKVIARDFAKTLAESAEQPDHAATGPEVFVLATYPIDHELGRIKERLDLIVKKIAECLPPLAQGA